MGCTRKHLCECEDGLRKPHQIGLHGCKREMEKCPEAGYFLLNDPYAMSEWAYRRHECGCWSRLKVRKISERQGNNDTDMVERQPDLSDNVVRKQPYRRRKKINDTISD